MTRRKGMHWYCILQYLLSDASGTGDGQFMSTFVGYDTNDICSVAELPFVQTYCVDTGSSGDLCICLLQLSKVEEPHCLHTHRQHSPLAYTCCRLAKSHSRTKD